ncbi:acyclic terpene utilization AtuA family protein [Nonomuraea angiospora]|uniref:acyclic terpene utilization AtuA family protein n=1 Tax=Nonomuraea angiospora TaxID=46172 RepID=UPI0029A00450|nr:acyclic terpene utilization AtuA family protein [Nonomuraea angiospora]MDX3103262.1 acyclic terpene utilization AtuA family protein [Nonomuraea angiospora]
MLRIGTWRSAGSLDVVVCGWHDGGPGPLETGIKLIYGVGGPMPDFPGLRVGALAATCAEEIAEALSQGIDVVATAPGCSPAAPVVGAGMWHYGWTGNDPGALAGATVAGLVMAAQPGPCSVQICRDGRSSLDGDVRAEAARACLAGTVPLESVRLSQEAPSRLLITPR